MTTKTRDANVLSDLFPAPKLSAVAKQRRELAYFDKQLEQVSAVYYQWKKDGSSWDGYTDYHDLPEARLGRVKTRLREQLTTAKRVLSLHGRRDPKTAETLRFEIAHIEAKHDWLDW